MSADKATTGTHAVPYVLQRVFSTDVQVTAPSDQRKDEQELRRRCFWDITRLYDHVIVIHALLCPPSSASSQEHVESVSWGDFSSSGRFSWAESKAQQSAEPGISVFTFILPSGGFATRVDYLQLRLQGCPDVISILDGLPSSGRLTSLRESSADTLVVDSAEALLKLTDQAAAIVQWTDLSSAAQEPERGAYLATITQELRCRLNAPWLHHEPIFRKRVAIVRGRPDLVTGGPVYHAARSLGVDLVVIDDEGHWLQADTDENRKHREAFLPTNMTEDAGVVDRIVKSCRSYPLPIHGIFTLSDNFFVVVAQVATALGLPTCPVSAFEVSVDKYLSRLLQNSPGHTVRVDSAGEMLALLKEPQARSSFSPSFPMIVKPIKGWSSECVSKVNSAEDLVVAVQKATSRHGGSAVVEPFFDGPEIDVNFVLIDGQILFCEIADEQPTEADAHEATVDDTFSAEALTLPSALPPEEQALAKSTLHKILVNLGFRTGVFHVEARMVNSRYEYRKVDGLTDLVPKPAHRMPKQEASCRLLEINARPPAYRVTLSTRHTYGVDFFAAHILAAIGERERLALAAVPFDFGLAASGRAQDSQCWSRLIYISAPAEGILKSEAPCDELKKRRPDLAKHIVLSNDYYKKGDEIALFANGARTCVGHVLVCSATSRGEANEIGEQVRRQFVFEVEDSGRHGEQPRPTSRSGQGWHNT